MSFIDKYLKEATDIYAGGKRKQQKLTIVEVIVSIVVSVVLLSLGYFCFLRRKERKNREDILKESCNDGEKIIILFQINVF